MSACYPLAVHPPIGKGRACFLAVALRSDESAALDLAGVNLGISSLLVRMYHL
jgi:hypothetical protein